MTRQLIGVGRRAMKADCTMWSRAVSGTISTPCSRCAGIGPRVTEFICDLYKDAGTPHSKSYATVADRWRINRGTTLRI
jgi:hypothetical protein